MTKDLKIKTLLIVSQTESGAWFLFDWKTALRHNLLIFNDFFYCFTSVCVLQSKSTIAILETTKSKTGRLQFVQKCTHLFPKWKQLK